ncbi:pantetheine-phosphate adenylyltransferase [Anoxybacter fermentans]|uniref:Phosphopantetheine adenylyltransferase n=1 Tax=Anoxybacter fermentans TaxID=1323375 RepID=A0A3S9SX84_9FIRM|nr:pantetheine-phosphate adenylyltransferase [Anoxybacter fermentans]AZR72868.1 pantetheine-phosphate adenylyltransferase [Anoxybacter fermentans]
MKQIAIYPGSFDPVTNGHLDIIERSSKIFEHIIVAVFCNPFKEPMFTMEERVEMLKEATKKFKNVSVDSFDGLLVDYAKQKNARIIIRGIRAVSDFEGEFQKASMNKKLDPNIETLILMSSNEHAFLSSSVVKEAALFGGCIRGLVPPNVQERMIQRIKEIRRMKQKQL